MSEEIKETKKSLIPDPPEKKPPFKPVKLTGKINVPPIVRGTGANQRAYIAKPDTQEKLGFPGQLIDNWQEEAIRKMGELLHKYKSLQVYMDICVRCGSCTDKCQFFLGSKDPKNMPVARQDLFRKVYRRYFTTEGKIFKQVAGAVDFDIELLMEWYNYYHQCTQCRRCSLYCPYGIDTAEISMAAREIMDSIGLGQKYTNEILAKVLDIGNNLGMNPKALANALEFLEEEIEEEDGHKVRIPLDEEGADVLLVTPSADFFAIPHMESLKGYAKVFHQAGISWTISSKASEAGNFGMFVGNYRLMKKIAGKVNDAIEEVQPKRLIVGECGHAWRVCYAFWNTLVGPFDSLDPRYPRPQHIVEATIELMNKRALKIDKSANDEFVVTFHDSCNVARGTRMGDFPGGQYELPRRLIKMVANNYVDMDDATIRERTFCCGGGGGILT
ncbi:MAG: (Fe-S)-binding protein, partial [Rubrobacteridae bacterium]|nr:(Fe-S)-binding protein [Rubrobacteridae bacterium]